MTLTPPSNQRSWHRTAVQVLDFDPHSLRSVQLYLLSLAEQLREKGWRTVHVFAREPGDDFRNELGRLNSPYLMAKFPLSLRGAMDLGRKLRAYRPDVLQTAYLSPFSPAVPALKKASRARFLVVNDRSSGQVSKKGFVKRLLARLRGAVAGAYIDRVIAVSNFVHRRDIEGAYLPAGKVRTIHNGVDLARYAPDQRTTNAVFTIGFVGQLIPEKGALTLLRAVKKLETEAAPPLRVLMAGSGRQGDELRQFCTDNGLTRVEFLGQIHEVPQLLASVDIAVFPSEWEEAFGFAVLEALACGCCVVASAVGGIPEVIGAGGEAGLLFRKGDVDDLKQKLRELIHDPVRREQMRVAARDRAVGQFSIERMVGNYVAVFNELERELASRMAVPLVSSE